MDKEQYIKDRIMGQLNYFEKKSPLMKKLYFGLAIFSTIGSIVTTFIVAYSKIAGGIIALLVAISIAVNELCRFKDKWILYRCSAEHLNSLLAKYRGASACGNFNIDEKFKELYENVETYLELINSKWEGILKENGSTTGGDA